MPPKKRQLRHVSVASEEYKKKLRSFQEPKPQPSIPKLSKKERRQYSVKAPYPQSYTYPPAIISYIARNPKYLDDHENLIKSAKSLLRISRLIPVEVLEACEDDVNKWMLNNHEFSVCDRSFDIWVTGKVSILTSSNPFTASILLKRIYRCTALYLELHHQILTLREIKFLFTSDELMDVVFIENTFKDDSDGSMVEFQNIFEILLKSQHVMIKLPSEQHGIGIDTHNTVIFYVTECQNDVCRC